jgi:hypothetical protein
MKVEFTHFTWSSKNYHCLLNCVRRSVIVKRLVHLYPIPHLLKWFNLVICHLSQIAVDPVSVQAISDMVCKSTTWSRHEIPQLSMLFKAWKFTPPICTGRYSNKGYARRGICPPSGKLSVGIWKVRFREKWNMVWRLMTPMNQKKIGPVDVGVRQVIDENQMQDGCRSGHGWAAKLIIERNLPLITPNKSQRNWINRPRQLPSNRWKLNPRWWPSWMSGGADHQIRKEPSSNHSQ